MFNLSVFPGLIAFLICLFVTPVIIKLAFRFKIVDNPQGKTHPKVIHTYPVPRAGGVALFFAVSIASLIFLPLDKHLTGILLGVILITITGVIDDKYNLNPYLRLLLNVVAALCPIAAGIGISFISNPMGGTIDLSSPSLNFFFLGQERSIWIISDLFAVIWIVFMMNMLNMGAKGVDGQLSGVSAIAAITVAALSLRFSADITQWPAITLASITAGAFLGFIPWHFYPQKIMPGYGGSTMAGFLLAVLSILSTTKVGTLMIVLAIPLIDTGYVIVRRIMEGKSPVWGDRKHLHHKLLDIGLSKKKVALLYWALTALLGVASLHLNTRNKLYTIISVAILLAGIILWLTYRPKQKEK